MRILVADGLEAEALAKLRAAHHVDVVEADPKQLLEIIPVETIDQVLEHALLEPRVTKPVAVRSRRSSRVEARP